MNTPSLLAKTTPITPKDLASPQVKDKLKKIQGNILKSHNRDHSVHLLLSIPKATATGVVKKLLGEFADQYVTSAAAQIEHAKKYKTLRAAGGKSTDDRALFGAVFLTAAGYRRLGYKSSKFRDPSFVEGMKVSGPQRLGDPVADLWDEPYRQPIHAMLLLASNNEQALKRAADALTEDLQRMAAQVTTEVGIAPRNEDGRLRDPFGYAHGVSQPEFFSGGAKKERGSGKWNPSALPSLVLVRDPLVGIDEDALGSYLVYRKLEMDVRRFNDRLMKLAKALGIADKPEASDHAAALVAGRYRNGMPLIAPAGAVATKALRSMNDFNYNRDKEGLKCPLQSHVRKANPRGSGKNGLRDEREHRIARRGVNYRDATTGNDGEPARGMLFMCYQAKIQRQFEFMQKRWLNNEDFPGDADGRDPVVGWGGGPWRAQNWPDPDQPGRSVKFSFGGFVQLKGGEYFFAPSIAFLEGLKKGAPPAKKIRNH